MPEQPNEYRVTVFGAVAVGKSSLVLRFVKGSFLDAYIPTIEDTFRQVVSCNKQVCTLQITDTTGSNQFPAMHRQSISTGHAFILVYSVSSRESFDELRPIYDELVRIKSPEISQFPIILVGNKTDEEAKRQVSATEGQGLANLWKISFMETSAKDNVNVKEVFQELLMMETKHNMALVGDSHQTSPFLSCFRFFTTCSVSSGVTKSDKTPRKPRSKREV